MSGFATITGVGGHLPGAAVGNDHFAGTLETTAEWIETRTGIVSRNFAAADAEVADAALPAASQALERAGVAAAELDLIIFATTTPDRLMPATACLLQAKLGASCPAFDVQAVCSGFVYGLEIAAAMVAAGSYARILVVGADLYSRLLDFADRTTCVLFGDGAGAAVVEASAKPGIVASNLGADGKLADVITTAGRVNQGRVEGSGSFAMDGPLVYKVAVKVMAASARRACADAGLEPAALDWLVVHQANLRIINTLARELGIADARVVRTVAKHANTSAASIPLALSTIWGRIAPGEHVLLVAAGGGLTWGSVLWRATARSGHR